MRARGGRRKHAPQPRPLLRGQPPHDARNKKRANDGAGRPQHFFAAGPAPDQGGQLHYAGAARAGA